MGYEGKIPNTPPALLENVVERAVRAVPPSMRRMTNDVAERQVEVTIQNTPVDTSALRNDIRQIRIRVYHISRNLVVYESGAYATLDYAKFVEDGTGLFGPKHAKYLIEPKIPGGTLSWVDPKTGVRVFAKKVWHPGSPGNHMFAIGSAIAESEFSRLCAAGMREYKERAEGRIGSGNFPMTVAMHILQVVPG
jgi:hypothetical protein